MFMPAITVTSGCAARYSTMELLTLEPSMSVRTYTASSGEKPLASASTFAVMGSLSSRSSVTACTFGASPTIMWTVSSAPVASPP